MEYWRYFLRVLILVSVTSSLFAAERQRPVCFYLASYAPGYAWQDAITREVKRLDTDKVCQLTIHYMNSKKVYDPARLQALGQAAYQAIQKTEPDIVLSSDDNAMKYVVRPYLKDAPFLPVVFCGINNSGRHYGLPFSNTTGMVEKMPFNKIFHAISLYKHLLGKKSVHIAYLVDASLSSQRNIKALKPLADSAQDTFTIYRTKDFSQWKQHFKTLNKRKDIDVIILGNKVGVIAWNDDQARALAAQSRKLTLAYLPSMGPYVVLNIFKSPQEQGKWMVESAKAILQRGYTPAEMNIVPNRMFPVTFNLQLIQHAPEKVQVAMQYLVQHLSQGY